MVVYRQRKEKGANMHYVTYMEFPENTTKDKMYAERSLVIAENGDYDCEGTLMSEDNGFILHPNTVCASRDDARECIRQLDNGWYDDHGVKFTIAKPTKAMENLKSRIENMRSEKRTYIENHHIANRKSDTITCPKCKSRLSLAYMKGDSCPLCHTDLRSNTVLNRIDKYDKDIANKEKQYREMERKCKEKAETRWLVKLEFHC